MHSLRKRHSWPSLRTPRISFLDNIDQDPYSHFISNVREAFVGQDDDLTAGIDTKPRSHSLSPRLHKTQDVPPSKKPLSSPAAKLKKWIGRMELRYFHGRSPPVNVIQRPVRPPATPKLPEIPHRVSPPARGRRDFRVGSSRQRNVRGVRRSARPQRVSRPPSGEIFTIAEEAESLEEVGLGIRL